MHRLTQTLAEPSLRQDDADFAAWAVLLKQKFKEDADAQVFVIAGAEDLRVLLRHIDLSNKNKEAIIVVIQDKICYAIYLCLFENKNICFFFAPKSFKWGTSDEQSYAIPQLIIDAITDHFIELKLITVKQPEIESHANIYSLLFLEYLHQQKQSLLDSLDEQPLQHIETEELLSQMRWGEILTSRYDRKLGEILWRDYNPHNTKMFSELLLATLNEMQGSSLPVISHQLIYDIHVDHESNKISIKLQDKNRFFYNGLFMANVGENKYPRWFLLENVPGIRSDIDKDNLTIQFGVQSHMQLSYLKHQLKNFKIGKSIILQQLALRQFIHDAVQQIKLSIKAEHQSSRVYNHDQIKKIKQLLSIINIEDEDNVLVDLLNHNPAAVKFLDKYSHTDIFDNLEHDQRCERLTEIALQRNISLTVKSALNFYSGNDISNFYRRFNHLPLNEAKSVIKNLSDYPPEIAAILVGNYTKLFNTTEDILECLWAFPKEHRFNIALLFKDHIFLVKDLIKISESLPPNDRIKLFNAHISLIKSLKLLRKAILLLPEQDQLAFIHSNKALIKTEQDAFYLLNAIHMPLRLQYWQALNYTDQGHLDADLFQNPAFYASHITPETSENDLYLILKNFDAAWCYTFALLVEEKLFTISQLAQCVRFLEIHNKIDFVSKRSDLIKTINELISFCIVIPSKIKLRFFQIKADLITNYEELIMLMTKLKPDERVQLVFTRPDIISSAFILVEVIEHLPADDRLIILNHFNKMNIDEGTLGRILNLIPASQYIAYVLAMKDRIEINPIYNGALTKVLSQIESENQLAFLESIATMKNLHSRIDEILATLKSYEDQLTYIEKILPTASRKTLKLIQQFLNSDAEFVMFNLKDKSDTYGLPKDKENKRRELIVKYVNNQFEKYYPLNHHSFFKIDETPDKNNKEIKQDRCLVM